MHFLCAVRCPLLQCDTGVCVQCCCLCVSLVGGYVPGGGGGTMWPWPCVHRSSFVAARTVGLQHDLAQHGEQLPQRLPLAPCPAHEARAPPSTPGTCIMERVCAAACPPPPPPLSSNPEYTEHSHLLESRQYPCPLDQHAWASLCDRTGQLSGCCCVDRARHATSVHSAAAHASPHTSVSLMYPGCPRHCGHPGADVLVAQLRDGCCTGPLWWW